MTSKRRSLILLVFLIKCISKGSLIRILRRENQLHLFRRLEQSSNKQIKCDGAIEFLRLCHNLDLTPTSKKCLDIFLPSRIQQARMEKIINYHLGFRRSIILKHSV